VWSIEKEQWMLAQVIWTQLSIWSNFRFGYFYSRNFFIKECSTLYNVDIEKFSLKSLPIGVVLRFC
jgi:hypothetical protein